MDSQFETKTKNTEPTLRIWMNRIRPHLIPIGLFLLTIILYANTFGHELLSSWDDNRYIAENPFIKNFSAQGLVDIYTNYYFAAYLPVTLTTYWIEFRLWGMEPAGYHIVNVVIQAFNGVLVYYFLRRLQGNWIVALIATVLFIVHPLQTETVVWVAERKALLSMLFLLLTFLAHMRSLDEGASPRWIVAAYIFFAASVFAKPITVGVPLLLIFYDYYWGKLSIMQIIRRNAVYVVIGIIGAYLIMDAHAGYGGIKDRHGGSLFGTAQIMSVVTWDYLVSLILPFNQNNFYPYNINGIIQNFDIRVILGFGVILFMAWFAWKEPLGKPISRFSILWIAVLIAPVSNIVPLSTLRADRYLYFPSVTIFVLVAILFMRFWERQERVEIRYAMVAGLAAIIGLFGALTIVRNPIWHDGGTLWADHLEDFPFSESGWLNKAYYHWVEEELVQSQYDFEQLVRLYPNTDRGHRYLGFIAEVNEEWERAAIHYTRALEIEPDPESDDPGDLLSDNLGLALFQWGLEEFDEGSYELALAIYNESAKYLTEEPVLFNNIGFTLEQLERYDEAIDSYRQALVLNPEYSKAAMNMMSSAVAIEDVATVEEGFEVVMSISTDAQILSNACQKLSEVDIVDERCTS